MKRDTNLKNPVTFAMKIDGYDMKQMKRISAILQISIASLIRSAVRNYLEKVVEYIDKVEHVVVRSKSDIEEIEYKIEDIEEEISPDGFRASEEDGELETCPELRSVRRNDN